MKEGRKGVGVSILKSVTNELHKNNYYCSNFLDLMKKMIRRSSIGRSPSPANDVQQRSNSQFPVHNLFNKL